LADAIYEGRHGEVAPEDGDLSAEFSDMLDEEDLDAEDMDEEDS
ncbi:MAG: 30S ribosomal protein S2, partial [Acaryochloridaceae cyanobacterium RL_2_7]|nr:30S ribosomal protein S2 [Acaryochloridaceae cyanobacterium RL_2_7]